MSSTERFTNLPSNSLARYSLGESLLQNLLGEKAVRSHLTVAPDTLVSNVVRLLSMQEGACVIVQHRSRCNNAKVVY